jgi:hypothetical protein
MTGPRHGDLAIGVIGPHDLVERVMLSGLATGPLSGPAAVPGPGGPGPGRRLVAAAYRDEQEAAEKVTSLGASVDCCLFASRVPQEYARRAGVLSVPSTCIPLGGSALYAALLRASRDGDCELGKSSFDTLSQADVDESLGELGIATSGVQIREDPAGVAALASFHERLWRRGATTAAFTCLEAVASRLAAAGVPAFTVRPTAGAIRSGLQTAALLGGVRRLEDAQLAVVIVEVPTLREGVRRTLPRQSREEIRLTVHKFLIQEAQRIQAAISPLGEHAFLITATRGSLGGYLGGALAAAGAAPLGERVRRELGISVEVGVGMGRTALDAEARARAALDRPARGPGGPTGAAGAAGAAGSADAGPALVPAPRAASAGQAGLRGLATLARLAGKLPASDNAVAVDAETAGKLLDVTTRTARRLLHSLVEDGLAWPLPPSRAPQPGRPRQVYRLVVERLDRSDQP